MTDWLTGEEIAFFYRILTKIQHIENQTPETARPYYLYNGEFQFQCADYYLTNTYLCNNINEKLYVLPSFFYVVKLIKHLSFIFVYFVFVSCCLYTFMVNERWIYYGPVS